MQATQRKRFEEMVMPHMDAAFNLARWLAGNTQEAEDISQESFLRAYRFFDGFRGNDARTWVLKIVRNTFYTRWRRVRVRDESTEFDEELHSAVDAVPQDPESIFLRVEDVKLLDRALAQLPVEYREVLVLRELEDLSYKQIADTLDIPIGTVMSRISRARRMLLEAFNRLGPGNIRPVLRVMQGRSTQ